MKKLVISLVFLMFLFSCREKEPIFELKILPIKEAKTPDFFEYQTLDTITVKYELPNACHSFNSIYYRYDNTSRIVAIYALLDLESVCTQATIEKEVIIPIKVLQQENYLFRFYKGKDADGKSIFEEIEVPVN